MVAGWRFGRRLDRDTSRVFLGFDRARRLRGCSGRGGHVFWAGLGSSRRMCVFMFVKHNAVAASLLGRRSNASCSRRPWQLHFTKHRMGSIQNQTAG